MNPSTGESESCYYYDWIPLDTIINKIEATQDTKKIVATIFYDFKERNTVAIAIYYSDL